MLSDRLTRESTRGDPPRSAPSGPRPRRERLGIAGSGTIACGLAACAAGHGLEVLIWARSARSVERAERGVGRDCEKLEQPEAAERVSITQDLGGLARATLAVEAVSEQKPVKDEVLAALSSHVGEETIIATTASSLRISDLARASGRPARFFGLHVFNPVHRMTLVELCFTAQTDAETRERATAFCEAIGKTPVEVPDETGFVVNRLLFPYLFDAVRLLERTGLAPEEIDSCMKLGASHPMGPLELLDLVGLDVAAAIGEAIYADTRNSEHRPPERIKRLIEEGRLGRKSGAGFHAYE
jgi:3-hydroxybutyryl-CoA dehydrogenase